MGRLGAQLSLAVLSPAQQRGRLLLPAIAALHRAVPLWSVTWFLIHSRFDCHSDCRHNRRCSSAASRRCSWLSAGKQLFDIVLFALTCVDTGVDWSFDQRNSSFVNASRRDLHSAAQQKTKH